MTAAVSGRMPIPTSVGVLLVLGAVLFWIGAVTPPYRQWTGVPLPEYLQIVGAHRWNWYAIHAFFAAGTVVTLAGIAGLHAALVAARSQVWSAIGFALWLAAAILWLVCLAHRVTMTLSAATALSQAGEIPSSYAATHQWMSLLFGVHMVLSYTALAAIGLALQQAASLPAWAARTALVFGVLGVPGLATPVFQPPLMLFVAPFVIGVAILRTPDPVG